MPRNQSQAHSAASAPSKRLPAFRTALFGLGVFVLGGGCQQTIRPNDTGPGPLPEQPSTSTSTSTLSGPGILTSTPSLPNNTFDDFPQPSTSGITSSAPTTSTPSTSTGPSTNTQPHLQYIVVSPGEQLVKLDLQASQAIAYKAVGHYSNGQTQDLSDQVSWSVSSPQLGSFVQRNLAVAAHSQLFVQSAKVSAKLSGVEGQAQITVAAYEQDGPSPDFLFVLPYQEPSGPKSQTLGFETKVPALDVFFSMDTTGSMRDEIGRLTDTLNSTIVPTLQSEIKSVQVGVGAVRDFPVANYGASGDQPFSLRYPISPDIAQVKNAVGALRAGGGRDLPEAILEALYQIATGEGLNGPGATSVASNKSGIGGVGFRKGSMPIVVSITDATSHAPGETDCKRDYNAEVSAFAHTREQTEAALERVCARVITVASAGSQDASTPGCGPRPDGIRLATATDAVVSPLVWNGKRPAGCAVGQCCTGEGGRGEAPNAEGLCPLVFQVDSVGTGLDSSIVSGVQSLAFFAPFDVLTEPAGENSSIAGQPLPAGKTTLSFIESIRAQSFGPLPLPGLSEPRPNGANFENVTPGTRLNFSIRAVNNFLRQSSKVQAYRARIGVKADQCEGLDLDQRNVIFVVPPKPLVAG